jgi:hypothetical protein
MKRSYWLLMSWMAINIAIVCWCATNGRSQIPQSPPTNQKPQITPPVTVGIPISGKVPLDTVVLTDPFPFNASISYVVADQKELAKNPSLCYLVLHQINRNARQKEAASVSTTTFPITVSKGGVLDPQFSPDGNHILLKIGLAFTRHDQFQLYVFDIKARKLKLASPDQVSFRNVLWSPDGRYIAYIKGGDAEGFLAPFSPPTIVVCNWQTGELQTVVEGPNALGLSMTWMGPQTLLFSNLSTSNQKTNPEKQKNNPEISLRSQRRPNVYAYSTATRKTQLLIEDGQYPAVSPDQQWIAFFGSEYPGKPFKLNDDWALRPGGAALSVVKRGSVERRPLTIQKGGYPTVLWPPDNRQLVTLRLTQESPNAKAEVYIWDTSTQQQKKVGSITATDFEEQPRSITYPQISALGVSRDGKDLIVLKQEYTGRTGPWLDESDYIQAMNLSTGKLTPLLKTSAPLGIDWMELPPTKSTK